MDFETLELQLQNKIQQLKQIEFQILLLKQEKSEIMEKIKNLKSQKKILKPRLCLECNEQKLKNYFGIGQNYHYCKDCIKSKNKKKSR